MNTDSDLDEANGAEAEDGREMYVRYEARDGRGSFESSDLIRIDRSYVNPFMTYAPTEDILYSVLSAFHSRKIHGVCYIRPHILEKKRAQPNDLE